MPRVEYIKSGPGAVKGSTRTMPRKSADVLVRLGYARYLTADLQVQPAGEPQEQKEPQEIAERAKRQYKRRDMTAESA